MVFFTPLRTPKREEPVKYFDRYLMIDSYSQFIGKVTVTYSEGRGAYPQQL